MFAYVNILISPISYPVIAGGSIVLPDDRTIRPDSSGNFSVQLMAGDYYLILGKTRVSISVPDDNQTYTLIDVLSSPVYQASVPALAGGGLIGSATLDRMRAFSNLVQDVNKNPISADVVWPDGSTGVYTALVVGTFVDSYQITHIASGQTVTQPLIIRDEDGYMITKPAMVIS